MTVAEVITEILARSAGYRHSTLTHRQGCLCVVCVGRRKREAKLRKSGAHAKSNKSAKKVTTSYGNLAVPLPKSLSHDSVLAISCFFVQYFGNILYK